MSSYRSFLALCACAPVVIAQASDETLVVELEITTIAGTSHYLDKGRTSGLVEGDRVTFFPQGGTSASGVIRAVSKSGARVELDPGSPALSVGTRGEARIPARRLAPPVVAPPPVTTPTASVPPVAQPSPDAPQEPQETPKTPAHPPWTHPPETWTSDKPLLAPAFGVKPQDRESRWRGRAWTQLDATFDRERGDRRYVLSRTGADVTLENPFGQGGELRVDANVFHRVDDFDGESESDSELQIDRLTYSFGGTEDAPHRFQFGRFLQHEFPALGLLDGIEWSHRSDDGSRLGASAGWMPEPKAGLDSFEDVQAALFYRHAFDDRERNTLGLALQSTWHDGEQDRNLVVTELETRPHDDVSLRASAWIDLYTSDDTLKGSGAELTELRVDGSWRFAKRSGLGFFASSQRWPELLRDEDELVVDDTIADGHVERVGAHVWHALTDDVRWTLRGDHWSDEDDSGISGETGATWRGLLGAGGDLSGALLYADGSYSSGPGLRLNASKLFGETLASLGYEFFGYEQKDFSGAQETLAQHGLFGTLDLPLGEAWDLLLRGEHRFGDEQDSYALGFLLQTRF